MWFPRHFANKLVHQNHLDRSCPFLTGLTHFCKSGWGCLVTLGTTTPGLPSKYSFFLHSSNISPIALSHMQMLVELFWVCPTRDSCSSSGHNPCIQWCVENIKLCVWSCSKWLSGILIFMGVRKVLFLRWSSNNSIMTCKKCVCSKN